MRHGLIMRPVGCKVASKRGQATRPARGANEAQAAYRGYPPNRGQGEGGPHHVNTRKMAQFEAKGWRKGWVGFRHCWGSGLEVSGPAKAPQRPNSC
jgi:hypothetical protein